MTVRQGGAWDLRRRYPTHRSRACVAVVDAIGSVATASGRREAELRAAQARLILGPDARGLGYVLDTLVERVEEIERLRRLADTDALTGVANRRVLSDAMRRELARRDREGTVMSVVLLDLDGLKRINDELGHVAGDLAITTTARACLASTRAIDMVARLGGDEFVLLLPGADPSEAEAVARRVREAIERESIRGQPLHVSVGIATADRPGINADSLIERADRSLYADKRRRSMVARRASNGAA